MVETVEQAQMSGHPVRRDTTQKSSPETGRISLFPGRQIENGPNWTWIPFCRGTLIAISLLVALNGCRTAPLPAMPALGAGAQEIDEAMLKNDEIVLLSSDRLDRTKPMLLLLHGATEDPMEMADIAKEWEENYNVLLYAHNFHEPIKVVASHLAREMKSLRKKIDHADAEGHIL